MTPTAIIARCINQCARHRDRRGPWQARRACEAALGGSAIDRDAAAAAVRIGLWLKGVGTLPPPNRGGS